MARKITGEGDGGSERFQPDDPLTLQEAAKHLLRGLVTASTLEAAIKRGELDCERLGRRIVVTPAMIRAWRDRNSRP